MRTVLEVTANKREDDNVADLGGELQAHAEVIFKQFVVETKSKWKITIDLLLEISLQYLKKIDICYRSTICYNWIQFEI